MDTFWFDPYGNIKFEIPCSMLDYDIFNRISYDSKEKDWKRTRFVSGGDTSPSESTRRKLRKKRKSRK